MQILVVVVNIRMRTLKTEVEKGSARTAIVRGLVDPKSQGRSVSTFSKGKRVNIPLPRTRSVGGNASELVDTFSHPGENLRSLLCLAHL